MQSLSYEIRSKPDWHTKRKDPDIRAKWRAEALGQNQVEEGLTEAMIDYTLDELELHEWDLNDPNGIRVSSLFSIPNFGPELTLSPSPEIVLRQGLRVGFAHPF